MTNRFVAAFQENFNVMAMVTTVAVSVALLHPLPLLMGIVAETVYLVIVPDTAWYTKRLAGRRDSEIRAQREANKAEALPRMQASLRERFEKMEEARHEIELAVAGDPVWMREVLRKLDFLLEKFLQFAVKDEQFRAYLYEARCEAERHRPVPVASRTKNLRLVPEDQEAATSRAVRRPAEPSEAWVRESVTLLQASYDAELQRVDGSRSSEKDAEIQAILNKRLEVLKRRREFIGKIGKIVVNLGHQLSLLEDTFGLVSDELLARSPDQVVADIDDVVGQTNAMTQVLEELAPYERIVAGLSR